MVAPGMLQNPSVLSWLEGIEPAWTLLDQDSFLALRRPPSHADGPIRFAANLSAEEIERSAVARNARMVLRAAAEAQGLKTTATGNLARSVVADLCAQFTWPDFDKNEVFSVNKVINEPDFYPLFFVRHLLQAAKLARRRKGFLAATAAGRKSLVEPHVQALQALLFQTTFWHMYLGYFGRGIHDGWPQADAGVVLWSLSVAATDWQSPKVLSRLCTIPIIGVLESQWDSGSLALQARILRPLVWFGLLEHREEAVEGSRFDRRHFYRKTPLFDRFLTFAVGLERDDAMRH